MIPLKQDPAEKLAAAEVMQQIPPSCKCIYIPTPSACGENPLLMAWMGRKPCLHLSALFSADGLMVCASCFPQQSSVSCFGAGRVGEAATCSLAGVPSPHREPGCRGAEGRGILPTAPLPGQPEGSSGGGRRTGQDHFGDSHILRADAYELFIKFPSYICH